MTSFVSDIILPPLSVLLPGNANLDLKFAVLRPGPHYATGGGYNTIEKAQEDGAVVMACECEQPYSPPPPPVDKIDAYMCVYM